LSICMASATSSYVTEERLQSLKPTRIAAC
jgi:hypothetical protein